MLDAVRTVQVEPTIRFDIFIAGDFAQAKQTCRAHCTAIGLCVHVERVDYVYTGGEEAGVKVGLINYPRFPKDHDELLHTAQLLADRLMIEMHQHSYTIVGPAHSIWVSRRRDQTVASLPHNLGKGSSDE